MFIINHIGKLLVNVGGGLGAEERAQRRVQVGYMRERGRIPPVHVTTVHRCTQVRLGSAARKIIYSNKVLNAHAFGRSFIAAKTRMN